jgi:hypothetical protein
MTDGHEQKFDFGFEEEDTIEGMKKLIVEEVTSFRAEVRAHARAAGQIRRQDRFVLFMNDIIYIYCLQVVSLFRIRSLPIPSRDEILNSPVQEHGPIHGGTSNYTAPNRRAPSPVMDDPSEELERELAGTHLAGKK